MRRISNALIFFFCGLISLYVALRISELIDPHKIFPDRTYNGCWEVQHCLIPSWYWYIVGVFLALPILAFVYFGFSLRAGRILNLEAAKKIALLFSATMILEMAGGVMVFFIKTM